MATKKKTTNSPKTYSKDHVLSMFEEIKDQFRAFGEGQDFLTEKIDKMDIRLSGVEDRLRSNSLSLLTTAATLKELKRDSKDSFKTSLDYLSRIDEEIQAMKDEAKLLKVTIKDKANKEKVEDFEKRLVKLEKLVFAKLA